MRSWRGVTLFAGFNAIVLLAIPILTSAQADVGWPPIDPADLKMTDNPQEPGGSAVVLDAWDEVDNPHSCETIRVRIKILREEGKKYANLQIPYLEKFMEIQDLRARTVSASGDSVAFDGQVLEADVVKFKRFKVHAKTLTLANVQTGGVIDYSYRLHWKRGFPNVIQHPSPYVYFPEPVAYPAAQWEAQRNIFVRHATLTLRPYPKADLRYHFVGFAKDPEPQEQPDGSIRFEINNLPAFVEEEAAPPEANLRASVAAYYTFAFTSPEGFWKARAKDDADAYASFLKKSGQAKAEVNRLLSATDTDEQKLRKLYARAQQIRMISFENSKTEKEIKREELKENKNVDDVFSHNYAYANEVNLAFLAMVQAAGFTASPIRVASRDGQLFQMHMYEMSQFNAMIVEVTVGGHTKAFDPATLYCPFEMVPWAETDTVGLRVSAQDPALVQIPSPSSNDAIARRKADVQLDADGNVEGEIQASFEGQEALNWRLEARNEDEAEKKSGLEDWIKAQLPDNAEVKLTSSQGWRRADGPLSATFHVRVAGMASSAGQRLLLPLGLFRMSENRTIFSSTNRVHPVYFRYSAEQYEEVTLHVPAQLAVESVPDSQAIHRGAAQFDIRVKHDANSVRVTTSFVLGGHYFPAQQFFALKGFYQAVGSAAEQQIVLKKSTSSTAVKSN